MIRKISYIKQKQKNEIDTTSYEATNAAYIY